MAHNDSMRTGRESEILVLDTETFHLMRTVPTAGHCCHNIYVNDEHLLFCRSREGTLACNGKDVSHLAGFARGLALDDHHIFVGVSQHAESADRREAAAGRIEVLNREFRSLGRIILPHGQVREIRLLTGDLALSNTRQPTPATRTP
jgi:hypothetical protein